MAKLHSLQSKDIAESNAAEGSVNIFEDTTAEKLGMRFKAKALSVLDTANTNAQSENEEFKALLLGGGADQAIQMSLKAWSEGHTINHTKFENFFFHLFEYGQLNGPHDRRWLYLAKALNIKNPAGEPLLNNKFLARLGSLQGLNPVLGFLDGDDREFSKDKFGRYYQQIDIGNLDLSVLARVNTRWLIREVSTPLSNADLRANKMDLSSLHQDDAGILPLLVDPERIKSIVSKQDVVNDRYIENLVGSFKMNYDETIRFVGELKSTNAPDYKARLLNLGRMLKTYGTTIASESFIALPENLISQDYSKTEIRTQIVGALQELTGLNTDNPNELLRSNAYESVAELERFVSRGSYRLAA